MIIKNYLIIAIIFINLSLIGCSKKNNDIPFSDTNSDIFRSVQQKLLNNNYKDAIKELKILHNTYPFGVYAQQIQLYLIYSYYKFADLSQAQIYIKRFLKFNPNYPHIDYVLYISGIINLSLDKKILPNFLGIDCDNYNPKHAYEAFHDFIHLMNRYPNSQYSIDANKKLIYLKERLARYELSIIKYYNKRGAYIAVINRAEKILRNFPDTHTTHKALKYMNNAYRKLQLNNQADKISKIIVLPTL